MDVLTEHDKATQFLGRGVISSTGTMWLPGYTHHTTIVTSDIRIDSEQLVLNDWDDPYDASYIEVYLVGGGVFTVRAISTTPPIHWLTYRKHHRVVRTQYTLGPGYETRTNVSALLAAVEEEVSK